MVRLIGEKNAERIKDALSEELPSRTLRAIAKAVQDDARAADDRDMADEMSDFADLVSELADEMA